MMMMMVVTWPLAPIMAKKVTDTDDNDDDDDDCDGGDGDGSYSLSYSVVSYLAISQGFTWPFL